MMMPDKKENEKLYQKISNYFQDKGGEANLDSLLEQIQNDENINDMFKNQQGQSGMNIEPSFENQQNFDPNMTNMPYSQAPIQPEQAFGGKRRGRQRKSTLTPMEEDEFEGKKFLYLTLSYLYFIRRSYKTNKDRA